MDWEPSHVSAPLRPLDPQSSSFPEHDHHHKRERSQTLGTTFVSTTVVPNPSSVDVLSSLINSLTLLSDTAREQIRSARQLEPSLYNSSYEPPRTVTAASFHSHANSTISNTPTFPHYGTADFSDGDEAEPPSVGYPRPKSAQRKRSSIRERWSNHGSTKDKAMNLVRSGSSQTMRRPTSGTSSIGIPSIERAHNGSAGSLVITAGSGTRSPLKMFLSEHQEDEYRSRPSTSQRDPDARSIKSLKTIISKHSTKMSRDYGKENHVSARVTPAKPQTPKQNEKSTSEHKTYSPLSPANRDDLGEHLIPSRHSSMRHTPNAKGTSKGRSPIAVRTASLRSKSFSAGPPEIPTEVLTEQPLEEEDSTLRRIRELQQAKERRHTEWRKESKRMDKSVRRSARSRSRTNTVESMDNDHPMIDAIPRLGTERGGRPQAFERTEIEALPAPVLQEIEIPSPGLNVSSAAPSPALSTPRKHKRSLSAGLRRSTSSRRRPVDDLRSVSEQVETFLTAPRLTQRIRHPRNGRTIAFSEVGDPDGYAVFCCVGMGLTRYVTSFYDDVARTQRLRLITPDRPGIGESSPFADSSCTPLAWVDDVAIICQTLKIDKFSLLAHSAGAIYALATALKMPDSIRGKIHLLAPWIPPSQFANGRSNGDNKAVTLPMAHKFLSVLPAPFLKAANSRFLSATSASIEPKSNKGWKKDRSIATNYDTLLAEMAADIQPSALAADAASARHSSISHYANTPTSTPPPYIHPTGLASPPHSPSPTNMKRQFSSSAVNLRSTTPVGLTSQARQALLDSELTHRTWTLATLNANPAVDLLICLERRRPIGFKYTDVHRGVVIHHGRKDARVPLENIQWLSKVMKSCELRVIDNEGHGLMASASVMSKVLTEIGHEWEEWEIVAQEADRKLRDEEIEKERLEEMDRRRFIRGGR